MILRFKTANLYPKWDPTISTIMEYFLRNYPSYANTIDKYGGRISIDDSSSIVADIPDENSWRLDRQYWLPLNCTHDYKPIKRCSQIHYSKLDTLWKEHPDIMFKPTGLPDPDNDLVYYVVGRPLCGNCEMRIGSYEVTGPSGHMFGL